MIYVESRVNNVKGRNHRNTEWFQSLTREETARPNVQIQLFSFIKMCELYFALLIDIFGVLFCFFPIKRLKKKKAVILKSNYK